MVLDRVHSQSLICLRDPSLSYSFHQYIQFVMKTNLVSFVAVMQCALRCRLAAFCSHLGVSFICMFLARDCSNF